MDKPQSLSLKSMIDSSDNMSVAPKELGAGTGVSPLPLGKSPSALQPDEIKGHATVKTSSDLQFHPMATPMIHSKRYDNIGPGISGGSTISSVDTFPSAMKESDIMLRLTKSWENPLSNMVSDLNRSIHV